MGFPDRAVEGYNNRRFVVSSVTEAETRPYDLHSYQADDSTPLSPVSDADPSLQVLLEQAQELLGAGRPITPVVAPAPVPAYRVPPRRSQNGEGVKTPTKWNGFRRFRDKFRSLLAKFNRASQGPITLSRGLVPEREENAEIAEGRFAKLFG